MITASVCGLVAQQSDNPAQWLGGHMPLIMTEVRCRTREAMNYLRTGRWE